jgi:hypothetical protein
VDGANALAAKLNDVIDPEHGVHRARDLGGNGRRSDVRVTDTVVRLHDAVDLRTEIAFRDAGTSDRIDHGAIRVCGTDLETRGAQRKCDALIVGHGRREICGELLSREKAAE